MLAPAALVSSAPAVSDGKRAFDALVAEHLPGLRTRAMQLCRTHMDPDDLLQDALMRAFRARSQLRDPRRTRSWLLSIVGNTFIDAIRKQRARPPHVSLDGDPDTEPRDEPTEPLPWQRIGAEELCAAIKQLPDDVRETYRLFALEGKDYTAIAAAVGILKSTVGTRLLRARKQLRVLLAAALENTP
jgi:RNA polymerase sigma-70 factor, ECF subfamily